MQLLEHEAKRRAADAGLPVPAGSLAADPATACGAAHELGGHVVVKAQVPVKGRGKAGGIVEATSPAAAEAAATRLLGSRLAGHPVETVLVERHIPSVQEVYLAVTIKAEIRRAVLLLGASGGVDVEDRADRIATVPVSTMTGMRPWHVWQAARECELPSNLTRLLPPVARAAYRMFTEHRAAVVELNPLRMTPEGAVVAADVRVVPETALAEPDRGDRWAIAAKEQGFDLVTLNDVGNVALVSTGAGGSLALVDLLAEAGLAPINFCDIRSGGLHGDPGRLRWALRALGQHPRLSCFTVNVFAGITEVVDFARLLVRAVDAERPGVPIVVRVEGRGADEARRVLKEAGLRCAYSLDDLIEKVRATVADAEGVVT